MSTVSQKIKTVQLQEADVPEMQRITGILVDFDNKTGRMKNYPDVYRHYLRSAVATAPSKNLKFIVKEHSYAAEYVYLVTAIYRDLHQDEVFTTSWIHEDGIKMERRELVPEHPAHKIVCLTDMFERGEEIII